MRIIHTDKAPAAVGPYSQAIVTGNLLITSGQAVLEAAGSGPDRVVKTVCFLADMGDFAAFNAVYAKYFPSLPARSCVAVKDLPKGVRVEVECVAEA